MPRDFLTVSEAVGAVLAGAALLAGCGGSDAPALARSDAAPLIALAARIPGEPACAQARDIRRLSTAAIRLVNAGRVPPTLAETMLGGVHALEAEAPLCLHAVRPSSPTPTPAPKPPPPGPGRGHGHGHDHHHDHGHERG